MSKTTMTPSAGPQTSAPQERLLNAAAALLEALPGHKLSTTQLNKALFYFDLAHLRDFGETYTGTTYIALRQGPVVAKYKDRLVKTLEAEGIARQGSDGRSKPIQLDDERPSGWGSMDAEAGTLARRVADWAHRKRATEISDFSHRNPGWKHAYDTGCGRSSSPRPINLVLALQQIVDEDPWLARPLEPSEEDAFGREAVAKADYRVDDPSF